MCKKLQTCKNSANPQKKTTNQPKILKSTKNANSSENQGSRPAVLLGTATQARRKQSALFRQGRFAEMIFIFEIHFAIASVENILHYFSTPKLQGGKPDFEMHKNIILF
jgi:hypothetical protein